MTNEKLIIQTARKLQTYIQQQELKPGEKLPTESQLQELLGVKRTIIREVIKTFASSNLVNVKQGSGMYLSESYDENIHFPKLRMTIKMLETEAIKEIIRNDISDDDWLLLKAKLSRRNQLLKDGEITACLDADIKFHVFIVKLSQNKYLEQWYAELLLVWQMFLSQLVFREDGYTGNTQLHNELYEALVSRDEKRAVQLISKIGGENVEE